LKESEREEKKKQSYRNFNILCLRKKGKKRLLPFLDLEEKNGFLVVAERGKEIRGVQASSYVILRGRGNFH